MTDKEREDRAWALVEDLQRAIERRYGDLLDAEKGGEVLTALAIASGMHLAAFTDEAKHRFNSVLKNARHMTREHGAVEVRATRMH